MYSLMDFHALALCWNLWLGKFNHDLIGKLTFFKDIYHRMNFNSSGSHTVEIFVPSSVFNIHSWAFIFVRILSRNLLPYPQAIFLSLSFTPNSYGMYIIYVVCSFIWYLVIACCTYLTHYLTSILKIIKVKLHDQCSLVALVLWDVTM